jgi:hypothetical protein
MATEKPCKELLGVVTGQLKDNDNLNQKFAISKTLAARKSMRISCHGGNSDLGGQASVGTKLSPPFIETVARDMLAKIRQGPHARLLVSAAHLKQLVFGSGFEIASIVSGAPP